jgi:hypothetical protein
MVNVLLILVFSVAVVAALFVIPSWMTRLAVPKVIKAFCQSDALDARHARTPVELGLAPPPFLQRMTRPRDYRPHALRLLREANVIRTAEDGRLYLSQRELGQELRCSTLVAHQIRTALKRYARKDGSIHSDA